MRVAFYLDTADDLYVKLAHKCIESIKTHMPHAEIIHLNGGQEKIDLGVKTLHENIEGRFCTRRYEMQSRVGEALIVGVDCIFQGDVSDVWGDFDLAITTDIRPGSHRIKFNSDVTFCRNSEFFKSLKEATRDLDFSKYKNDWEPIETTYAEVALRYKTKILDGNVYNYVPSHDKDINESAKIIHYRGKRKVWLVGTKISGFESGLNTPMEKMVSQAEENLKRELPLFIQSKKKSGRAIIVGGGPSLKDTLPDLREKIARKGTVFVLNGTHDWLIERGIIPDYHVLLDARRENVCFVRHPRKEVTYLVAAQCHREVFDSLNGHNVVMWIGCFETDEQNNYIGSKFPNKPIMMVGGGATVGLKAINLAYLMGFRKIDLYGFDSCYREGRNHAFDQPLNDKESRIEVTAANRLFVCAPWMAKQAKEFQWQARQMVSEGCEIKVHGDGLISWIVKQMNQEAA